MDPIYFFFLHMEVKGVGYCLAFDIFLNSLFVFNRTKIFIQVWNNFRVSKWWCNFNFWVNYPLIIINN